MNIPQHPRSRGFTLIELLTVIAIIGILAAIIIPTVGKVRETAKSSICSSNIRQSALALRLCATDRKDTLPRPFNNAPTTINGTLFPNPNWHEMIQPYLPPRDKDSWNKGAHEVMRCPSVKWDGVPAAEVGASYSLAGAAVGLNGVFNDPSRDRRLTTIANPSMSPMLIDGAQQATSGTEMFYAKFWLRNADIVTDAVANTNVNADFRHNDAVTVAMADNSIKRIKRTEWVTVYPSLGPRGNRKYLGLE